MDDDRAAVPEDVVVVEQCQTDSLVQLVPGSSFLTISRLDATNGSFSSELELPSVPNDLIIQRLSRDGDVLFLAGDKGLFTESGQTAQAGAAAPDQVSSAPYRNGYVAVDVQSMQIVQEVRFGPATEALYGSAEVFAATSDLVLVATTSAERIDYDG